MITNQMLNKTNEIRNVLKAVIEVMDNEIFNTPEDSHIWLNKHQLKLKSAVEKLSSTHKLGVNTLTNALVSNLPLSRSLIMNYINGKSSDWIEERFEEILVSTTRRSVEVWEDAIMLTRRIYAVVVRDGSYLKSTEQYLLTAEPSEVAKYVSYQLNKRLGTIQWYALKFDDKQEMADLQDLMKPYAVASMINQIKTIELLRVLRYTFETILSTDELNQSEQEKALEELEDALFHNWIELTLRKAAYHAPKDEVKGIPYSDLTLRQAMLFTYAAPLSTFFSINTIVTEQFKHIDRLMSKYWSQTHEVN